jgi:hypothetical protein
MNCFPTPSIKPRETKEKSTGRALQQLHQSASRFSFPDLFPFHQLLSSTATFLSQLPSSSRINSAGSSPLTRSPFHFSTRSFSSASKFIPAPSCYHPGKTVPEALRSARGSTPDNFSRTLCPAPLEPSVDCPESKVIKRREEKRKSKFQSIESILRPARFQYESILSSIKPSSEDHKTFSRYINFLIRKDQVSINRINMFTRSCTFLANRISIKLAVVFLC